MPGRNEFYACPVCGERTKLTGSVFREKQTKDYIRRRFCNDCGFRFWTKQQVEQVVIDQRVSFAGFRQTSYVDLIDDCPPTG
jgi:transcriptional regulator NrdR family protein